jgi:uncharacterized protein YciI
MKVVAIIEYNGIKEQVQAHHKAHREYLRQFLANEQLRAAGPFADDAGALWVLEVQTTVEAEKIVKGRDSEFALSPSQRSAEIRSRFAATLAECRKVIGSLSSARLLETIDPQPMANSAPMTILEAIYRITGHLQLHQGQIILLTKQFAGADLDLSLPRKR